MPTYEYLCEKCEHEFEREQRISDSPVKTCPKCRARKVTKLISRTSFVLKGGGWYSDLYSSAKGKADGDGSSSESSDTSKQDDTSKKKDSEKPSTKSSSKADSKADSKPGGKSGASKKSAA